MTKKIVSFFIPIIAVLIGVFCIRTLNIFIVSGESMYPTFKDSDILICYSTILDENEIHRMDRVIIDNDGENIIKRIIGLPGETVSLVDGYIYIDDVKLDDVVDIKIKDAGLLSSPILLDDNEYFVLGDNRNNSLDSRTYGAFSFSDIITDIDYNLRVKNKDLIIL